jgi:hypothetical protein
VSLSETRVRNRSRWYGSVNTVRNESCDGHLRALSDRVQYSLRVWRRPSGAPLSPIRRRVGSLRYPSVWKGRHSPRVKLDWRGSNGIRTEYAPSIQQGRRTPSIVEGLRRGIVSDRVRSQQTESRTGPIPLGQIGREAERYGRDADYRFGVHHLGVERTAGIEDRPHAKPERRQTDAMERPARSPDHRAFPPPVFRFEIASRDRTVYTTRESVRAHDLDDYLRVMTSYTTYKPSLDPT